MNTNYQRTTGAVFHNDSAFGTSDLKLLEAQNPVEFKAIFAAGFTSKTIEISVDQLI